MRNYDMSLFTRYSNLNFRFLFQDFIFIFCFIFMGCVAFDVEGPKLTLYTSKSPVIDNLSDSDKDKLGDLIQVDDLINLAVVIQQVGAKPNSQISDSRMRWMLTHLCCRWDADNSLQYLLKNYFLEHPADFIDFINAPTIQGYTCLHLCALWQSEKCFYVLHHYGGLSLNAKDKMFKTPLQSAVEYKCAKMKQVLSYYKQLGINFTQVQTEKLISGQVIAEDIEENNKRTRKDKKQSTEILMKKKADNLKSGITDLFSDLQKNMLEQKKKLEKQKQQILQSKLKQQLQADAKKAKMLADSTKNQIQDFQKAEYQKKIKKQIQQESKKQQQKIAAELKAKQEQLNKVKDELIKKQEQRIKKQKQEAQKKTQQFMRQKQQQINKKIKEKQDALNNLKKQQEERVRKEKQQAEKRIKQAQQEFKKKQQLMKQQLQQKQQQIQNIKKQQQERLRKQKESAEQKTKQAIKQSQDQFNKKLKQKQQEMKKFKEQETQRLKKQKQEAEKRALQLAKQSNRMVSHKLDQARKKQQQLKNTVNSNANKAKDAVNSVTNQLKQAYDKLKQQVPSQINKAYNQAKSLGMFVDNEFPANNKSIGDPSKANFSNFTNNTVWLRPRQILKGDFKLFDGIDPNDIKQGSLGVCYMLATVSSLASNPKNIQNIFVFYDTTIGFYVLKLFINGKPKYITVDDQIPCNKTTKSPLFTKPIGNQIWVLLIEKAWAKVIGDYLSAQAMTPDHMMQDLTSAPSYGSWFEKQANKSNTEHIKQIVKHSNNGFIVVITSGDKKIQGIANNHAYTMLKVYETNGRYLFKVRNPWGQFQWNGQYGQKSSLWSPQLKKLVGFEQKDDGIFHLSQNQLTNAFVYYSISQIKENNFYTYMEFTSKKNQDLFFKFKKSKNGDANIRITQLFDRMQKDKSYKYSPMVFQLGKITGQKSVKFISEGSQKSYFGAKSVHSTDSIFEKLDAGQYFIRIRMLWVNQEKYNKGILGIYADQPITIQKLSVQKGSNYMKALMFSFASNIPRNETGDGFYKIATMKGQFVLIGQTQKTDNHQITFTFTKSKMQMCQTDLGKVSDQQIKLTIKKGQPAIGTAMRTQPAKGGTTGPVSILVENL